MRATVNYESIAKMVRERLFPEPQTEFGTYPRIRPDGTVIFEGHALQNMRVVQYIRCSVNPDGFMLCKHPRHVAWLQEQADQHGLRLDLEIITPPPPMAKKPKPDKKPKSQPTTAVRRESPATPKPAPSLRDMLKARKAVKS